MSLQKAKNFVLIAHTGLRNDPAWCEDRIHDDFPRMPDCSTLPVKVGIFDIDICNPVVCLKGSRFEVKTLSTCAPAGLYQQLMPS